MHDSQFKLFFTTWAFKENTDVSAVCSMGTVVDTNKSLKMQPLSLDAKEEHNVGLKSSFQTLDASLSEFNFPL